MKSFYHLNDLIQHKQSNKIGNSLRDLRSTLFFALSKISIEFSQIGIQFSCVTYRDSKKQAFLVIYSFAWYNVLPLHRTQMHLNGISIVFFCFSSRLLQFRSMFKCLNLYHFLIQLWNVANSSNSIISIDLLLIFLLCLLRLAELIESCHRF